MRNKIIFLILFFNTTTSYGQINFERGYLIDNQNRKIECLIKNIDWARNPKEFEYKLNEKDSPLKGNLITVKEFGVYNFSKYLRVDTKIDYSPELLSKLSRTKDPVWHQEQVFLKVLVEGKASLYYFRGKEFTRLFYSISDSNFQQLVFKQYMVGNHYVGTNFGFRQQLVNDVRCANTSISSIESINYSQKELERYFMQYNECAGDSSVVFNPNKNKNIFNLRVTPGINYSSLSIVNPADDYHYKDADFGNKINFRLGMEAEYILPFNKNKWGIIFEPTFQYFNSQKLISIGVATIKYKTIEFSIGIRHYFFIGEKTKIFLNGFLNTIASIDFNSKIKYPNSVLTLEMQNIPNISLGGGIDYKRISTEIRYYTNKKILNMTAFVTDFQKISFIIGYKFLKTKQKTVDK